MRAGSQRCVCSSASLLRADGAQAQALQEGRKRAPPLAEVQQVVRAEKIWREGSRA